MPTLHHPHTALNNPRQQIRCLNLQRATRKKLSLLRGTRHSAPTYRIATLAPQLGDLLVLPQNSLQEIPVDLTVPRITGTLLLQHVITKVVPVRCEHMPLHLLQLLIDSPRYRHKPLTIRPIQLL